MSLLRRLGKEVLIYGFGKAIGMALGMLFVPVYARVLGTEGYGYIDLISVIINLIGLCSGLGLDSAVGFYYFDAKDPLEKRRVLFNAFLLRMISICVCSAAGYGIAIRFASIPQVNAEVFTQLLWLGVIRLPFSIAQAFSRDLLRLEGRPWTFFWCTLLYSILSVGFPILFVLVWKRGMIGVFEAALATEAICGLLFSVIVAVRFYPSLSFSLLGRMLKYGLPLSPASFFFFFVQSSDRGFILDNINVQALGVYTVAYKIVGILMFAISSYQLSWNIFGVSIKDDPAADQTYIRVLSLYALGFGFGAAALALFGFEVLALLTTSAFYDAAGLIGFLCIAQVAAGMFNQVVIGAVVAAKTIYIPIAVFIGCALNIAANYLLIPPFGLYGAAIASVIGYGTSVVMMFLLSQRVHRIAYQVPPLVIAGVLAAAAAVAAVLLPHKISGPLIGGKVVLLALIGAVFWITAQRQGILPAQLAAWFKKPPTAPAPALQGVEEH